MAEKEKGPPAPTLTPPEKRQELIGHGDAQGRIAQMIDAGDFTNGWLITGPDGIGKATLAFRAVRQLLNTGNAADDSSHRLIAAGAHPDVFVARRPWIEKTQKFATEITVDVIRKLTASLANTPAMGGWRVGLIDTADELNRNAANALLKVLEEPPARTTLILLAAKPGRLLPTIRSRCRRIDLRPAQDSEIAPFVAREAGIDLDAAAEIARAAGGRAGFALRLAVDDGLKAVRLLDNFFSASHAGRMPEGASGLVGKGSEGVWQIFTMLLEERLAQAVIRAAQDDKADRFRLSQMIDVRDRVIDLLRRCEALNLDRGQVVSSLARSLASVKF